MESCLHGLELEANACFGGVKQPKHLYCDQLDTVKADRSRFITNIQLKTMSKVCNNRIWLSILGVAGQVRQTARRLSDLTDRSEELDVRGQIYGNLRANSMAICQKLP